MAAAFEPTAFYAGGFEAGPVGLDAYAQVERSVQDALPIELYTFAFGAGAYRLTSAIEDTTFGSLLYTSVPLSRSNVVPAVVGKGKELTISLAVDHPVAQALLLNGIPQQDVTITIMRMFVGIPSGRQIFRGYIASVTTDGALARIRALRDLDDAFAVQLPVISSSRGCQHQLYDAGCRVGRTIEIIDIHGHTHVISFALTGSVTAIDGTTITVSYAGSAPVDGWGKFGILEYGTETRSVLSQIGGTIIVDVPFRTLVAGSSVLLYPGCDHTVTTCRDKFDNVVNFGGDPQFPDGKPTAPNGYGVITQE
ncbi:MAG: hypothetical protein QOI20_3290 [Acidimicrobiaceae bacterium]|jgi:hypothetical protein|nr:hypothetical protein [Acidimicrobiaceae bacterium]